MKPHHRLLDFVSHLDSADRNAAERALFAELGVERLEILQRLAVGALEGEVLLGAAQLDLPPEVLV